MNLLENLKMSRLIFSFVMIYIIHKMLVLLKITWIISKIILLNAFLRSIIDFYFLKKNLFFFIIYNDGKSKAWRRKHN